MDVFKKESIVRAYIESYNNFDIDGMLTLLSETISFENYSNGQVTVRTNGKRHFEKLARESADLFIKRCQQIEKLENLDNLLIAHIRFTGTLKADSSSDRTDAFPIDIKGRSEFQFNDSHIIRLRDYS